MARSPVIPYDPRALGEARTGLRGLADQQLGGALAGRAISPSAAMLAQQLSQARAQQAQLSQAPAALRGQAMQAMLPGAVNAAAPVAGRISAEQYGQAGQGVGMYGGLAEGERMGYAQDVERYRAARAAEIARQRARWGLGGSILGGLTTGLIAAGFGALSDRRAKSGLAPADSEADALLRELQPRRFNYRGEGGPAHVGVVAQEVEGGGPMGEEMVFQGEDGMRRLDGMRGAGVVMQLMERLERRLAEREGRTDG